MNHLLLDISCFEYVLFDEVNIEKEEWSMTELGKHGKVGMKC